MKTLGRSPSSKVRDYHGREGSRARVSYMFSRSRDFRLSHTVHKPDRRWPIGVGALLLQYLPLMPSFLLNFGLSRLVPAVALCCCSAESWT